MTKPEKKNIIEHHEKIAEKNHQEHSESGGRPMRACFVMISFFGEDRICEARGPERTEGYPLKEGNTERSGDQ